MTRPLILACVLMVAVNLTIAAIVAVDLIHAYLSNKKQRGSHDS